MAEKSFRDGKFSEEQLRRLRKFKLWMTPVRLVIALSVFSLAAGGPKHFFAELPGQVFSILFSVFVVIERVLQPPDFGGKGKDEGSIIIGWVAFGAAYALAIADWYLIRPKWALLEWSWWWLLAGALIVALGSVIRVISIRALGRFFTARVRLHEGQTLIREGFYKYIRHPSYTGVLLGVLGCITLFASVLGFAAFVLLMIPSMLYRIRVEELALIEQFGDEYLEYCKNTKRLIPFIY
jgi:protein-S-isoprenylcysteine O-methyltransferase Ste14